MYVYIYIYIYICVCVFVYVNIVTQKKWMFEKVRFTMCLGLDTGLYIQKPHLFGGCYNFYQDKDRILAYKTRVMMGNIYNIQMMSGYRTEMAGWDWPNVTKKPPDHLESWSYGKINHVHSQSFLNNPKALEQRPATGIRCAMISQLGHQTHKIKHERKDEKKNIWFNDLDHFAFQPLKVISMISTATFGDFSLSHGSAWEGSRGTRGTEAARFVGHGQILSVSTGCASFSYELLNIRDFKIYVKIYIYIVHYIIYVAHI